MSKKEKISFILVIGIAIVFLGMNRFARTNTGKSNLEEESSYAHMSRAEGIVKEVNYDEKLVTIEVTSGNDVYEGKEVFLDCSDSSAALSINQLDVGTEVRFYYFPGNWRDDKIFVEDIAWDAFQ